MLFVDVSTVLYIIYAVASATVCVLKYSVSTTQNAANKAKRFSGRISQTFSLCWGAACKIGGDFIYSFLKLSSWITVIWKFPHPACWSGARAESFKYSVALHEIDAVRHWVYSGWAERRRFLTTSAHPRPPPLAPAKDYVTYLIPPFLFFCHS